MALLFVDGFDHYGNGNQVAPFGKWGSALYGGASASNAQSRTGGFSATITASYIQITSRAVPASGGVVVGLAVYLVSGSTHSGADFLRVSEGATDHLVLGILGTGVVQVRRGPGGGAILGTGTRVLNFNTWYYLELKGTIHDSAGDFELRIDGTLDVAGSAVDTRNGGTTGQWDRVTLFGMLSGAATHFDDFYLSDTSGAAPRNTFLGPVKVETLYPQTDAVAVGSSAGLTPSTGTDHGALVDEPAPNTSDYNSGATVGVKDTYNVPSPSLTGAVLGVQTNLYVQKTDTTGRAVCAVVRAGGVDYDGATVGPTTAFAYLCEVRAQNPNTAADWLLADLTTVQVGMKVTA